MTITLTREEAQQVLDDLEALTAYIQGIDKGIVLSTRSIELLRARLAQPEPKQRTGDCLLTGVCVAEGHHISKAQREWQGLTDEEIEQIVDQHWEDLLMFAEAIEAKLKENNT